MIVAAGQASSVAGDLSANVATAARLTRLAGLRAVRLLVLPEAFLTGTTPRCSPARCPRSPLGPRVRDSR